MEIKTSLFMFLEVVLYLGLLILALISSLLLAISCLMSISLAYAAVLSLHSFLALLAAQDHRISRFSVFIVEALNLSECHFNLNWAIFGPMSLLSTEKALVHLNEGWFH
jgi:hypothetical protein